MSAPSHKRQISRFNLSPEEPNIKLHVHVLVQHRTIASVILDWFLDLIHHRFQSSFTIWHLYQIIITGILLHTVHCQTQYHYWLWKFFVCFVALRPESTAMVMAGRSVHLTTLFSWARLNKQLTSTFACN